MQLTGLKEINLDSFYENFKFPTVFPSAKMLCREVPGETKKETKMYPFDIDSALNQEPFVLPLPPSLEVVNMRHNGVTYAITEISFSENNTLWKVNLTGNVFQTLKGPIHGLHKLHSLDMSSCFIENISDKFFSKFTSLENLTLYQNLLGDELHKDQDGGIFSDLPTLQVLNLAFNNIFSLPENIFTGCPNLMKLEMSVNRLQEVLFSVSHMKNLKYLGLAKNSIRGLRKVVRDHIDTIINAGGNFSLDLQRNSISCECENLSFLKWLVSHGSNILVDYPGNYYYCGFGQYNDKKMIRGYDDVVRLLERKCADNSALFIGVLIGTLIFLAILLGVLAYRFRWSLRYWFYAVKLTMNSAPAVQGKEYEYDVFICYSHLDEDFVADEMRTELGTKRGLRLLIHGETFQVGRAIIDNIIMAVRQCRKTVVIMTKSMLNSKWCRYELQMARMEAINTRRDVLLFLFLDSISCKEMSMDIVAYIKTTVVLSYPLDPRHRKTFWDKLARDLKAT